MSARTLCGVAFSSPDQHASPRASSPKPATRATAIPLLESSAPSSTRATSSGTAINATPVAASIAADTFTSVVVFMRWLSSQNPVSGLSFCLALEEERNAQRKNQRCDAEQRHARHRVRLFDDYFPCHRDQRNLKHDPHVNDVFPDVRFQRFQQLDSDQHQQEVPKDLQQALHGNKPPGRLQYLFPDKPAQVH